MKIDARFFGEYVVTGTFFWIGQLAVLFVLVGGESITTLVNEIVGDLKGYQAALAAIALVWMFFTGLMLDLFTAYFPGLESRIFKPYLDQNHGWIESMVQHGQYFQRDDLIPNRTHFGFVQDYSRLQSRLLSYVMVFGEGLNLDPFLDDVRLTKTSRAIAAASWVFLAESAFLLATGRIRFEDVPPAAVIIVYALFFACIAAARNQYKNMCLGLFSLAHAIAEMARTDNINRQEEGEQKMRE